jgi:hypothetical protein
MGKRGEGAPERDGATGERGLALEPQDRRAADRRQGERRHGDRRAAQRRATDRGGPHPRRGERRRGERRARDRRQAHRRVADRIEAAADAGAEPAPETRALPMTLISPVPRRWAWWLRFVWASTRLTLRLVPHAYPFGRLQRLSFIHFAHWSLIYRVPADGGRKAKKLPHPYLIFQTNFNRGWREYVEGFCHVVPVGLRANWSGPWWLRRYVFGNFPGLRAYGFPPPQPVGPFLDYVEKRFTPAAHTYCAYPDVSARGVIAKTDARRKFGIFAGAGARPPDRFVKPARGPTPLGGPRDKTDTLSVLTPVLPGYHRRLERTLQDLPARLDRSPLAPVPDTHMARWSVVAPLPYKKGKRKIDSTYYLLFSSWFDGETAGYVRGLRSHLMSVRDLGGRNIANEIWRNCAGYPGTDDLDEFLRYLMLHSIKPRLAFAGYPQRQAQVRAAVELHDLLAPAVTAAAHKTTVALEEGYRHDRQRRFVM